MSIEIAKEAKEREAEISASGRLIPPTMTTGQVGPRETPGPKSPVGSQSVADTQHKRVDTVSLGAKVETGPRVAQLDPRMVLQVELLATKKKLAEADEKMGLWAVQDARRRKQDLDREESSIMLEVSRQLGAPAGSTITLIDKARGLCQVG